MSSDPNIKIKIVFACLDWRLHPQIEKFFAAEGGVDMCVTAGSIKDLIRPETQEFFLKQIEISKRLHNCQGIVLTEHMDCGAYGGSNAFSGENEETAAYQDQLKIAAGIIRERFADIPVETWIIGLEHNESGWNIKPEKIEL